MKILSFIVTTIFVLLIAFQWHLQHSHYQHGTHQLVDDDDTLHYLQKYEFHQADRIPTGIYVDSLKFSGPNDVHVSGYIWQEYSDELLVKHKPGVVFPDSVGGTIMKEAYKKNTDELTVIGWHFETNLRQAFSYSDYPIDHKTVWIKVLPSDFNSNAVLVPSLKAYDDTSKESIFGISEDIVLSGWYLVESFFNYRPVSFDTDFGLHDHHPKTKIPELTFNIVIERDFLSAFMINITLLLVSIALLYSLIIMTTSDERLRSKFGASVSSVIGSCAGIFFVVLIAHISIREQFTGSGIVYIEYFYLISYLFILGSAVSIYKFNSSEESARNYLLANDALVLKVGFWPLYTMLICIITWHHFY